MIIKNTIVKHVKRNITGKIIDYDPINDMYQLEFENDEWIHHFNGDFIRDPEEWCITN